MGFAFEDETGLPVLVPSEGLDGRQVPEPTPLAVQGEPAPIQPPEAAIMLRVQRFADETAEEAKQRARAVISDAHVEAATIVARARREAEGIAAQATLPDATGAVADLCSVIEEFSRTSRALVDELVHLRLALAGPYSDTPISPGPEVSVPPPVVG